MPIISIVFFCDHTIEQFTFMDKKISWMLTEPQTYHISILKIVWLTGQSFTTCSSSIITYHLLILNNWSMKYCTFCMPLAQTLMEYTTLLLVQWLLFSDASAVYHQRNVNFINYDNDNYRSTDRKWKGVRHKIYNNIIPMELLVW